MQNRIGLIALVVCATLPTQAAALGSFVTFESGHVRPLALSPDGTRLFAVNTPDNRLELFDIDGAGNLTPAGSVPVGMEPVAVAARTNTEVWVVNHLSDSVSIVDVGATPARVVRTLHVGDEPRDLVFAGPGGTRAFITTAHRGQNSGVPASDHVTAGLGRADVWVFDATNLGTALGGMPLTVVPLFGDTPRPLAVSPDGSRVYAGVFHSGNQTTTINEGLVCNGGDTAGPCATPGGEGAPGGLPAPGVQNCAGQAQPEVGLIVRVNPTTGKWEDELGRDWSALVKFNLPDEDVFVLDANAPVPGEIGSPYVGVGTILFNMVTNPVTGRVYVTNTEARNEVRFEGPGSCSTTVQGHLHEARITVLDPGGAVTPRHLNKHIDYAVRPAPAGVKAKSLATPVGMAVTPDGATLYVAAFGSAKVGVIGTAALEADTFVPDAADHIALSAGGPSGLVLRGNRLYVATRFDNGISTIDTTTQQEIAHRTLPNPEPAHVVAGRPFLYDAVATSSNGEASCAACHVFGDFDSLAWDLGDPDESTLQNLNPIIFNIGQNPNFRPMKGPMTTQSLRGMADHGPMHWRGDRSGANDPGGDALDENAAFMRFNPAFEGLVGNHGPIPQADMQKFTDFILDVVYPPNPNRQLDNADTATQATARGVYNNVITDAILTCNGCHVLDPAQGFFGSDGGTTFENETQLFKVAHLRNMYQKVGMFGFANSPFISSGDNGHKGDQIRGFGYLHDGAIDTLRRFLNATVFSLNATQRAQMEDFILNFPTTLAPIVGQQVTLTSTNAAVVGPRITLMIQRAQTAFALVDHPGARECDLIVKGTVAGEQRGWLLNAGSGTFLPDRAADPALTDAQLRAIATTPGQELTYTCAPPGSGVRMGIDRNENGILDGDEPIVSPTGCFAAPAASCREGGRSILVLKDNPTPAKKRLVFKSVKGPATVAADFGAPDVGDAYALCLYDGTDALLASAAAPAGGLCTGGRPCWKNLATKGFRYANKATTPDGLLKVLLRAGDTGKSKVIVTGKGADLSLPGLPVADLPVTVQVQGAHGECWTAGFDAASMRVHTATNLKAKTIVP